MNESIATTKVADCLYDEQIPVNADGDYTIVSSTAEKRPSNATAACGVAWLGWPKKGDGEGHTSDGMLIVRNTLPDPDFTQAVQDVATPGTEATVMGPYLPTGLYTTKAGFEGLGCPVDH